MGTALNFSKYFDTEDEISAGYKHLIADFMDYILGDVIRVVSKDIKTKCSASTIFYCQEWKSFMGY